MNCSFGEQTVDLTRVEEAAPDCCLEANCSFGDLTILLPRRFRGELESSTAFGSVDVSGHPDTDAVPIRLLCSVSFGEITIRYI